MAKHDFQLDSILDADIAAISNQEEIEPYHFSSEGNGEQNLLMPSQDDFEEINYTNRLALRKSSLLQPTENKITRNKNENNARLLVKERRRLDSLFLETSVYDDNNTGAKDDTMLE